MYQPWVAHFYPGLTPDRMGELSLTQYVALWDSLPAEVRNG